MKELMIVVGIIFVGLQLTAIDSPLQCPKCGKVTTVHREHFESYSLFSCNQCKINWKKDH